MDQGLVTLQCIKLLGDSEHNQSSKGKQEWPLIGLLVYLDALEGTEKKIPLLLDFKLMFDLFARFGRNCLEFLLTNKTTLKL